MARRRDGIGVVRAARVRLEGEDAVTSMAARQAATAARRFLGAIQALMWISLATGVDARRERNGDGDRDLVERQGASARRRHVREDGGEDTAEDGGGDSGEDTREEEKEDRRRERTTTTTTSGRVDEDARAVESRRSGVDDDGEGDSHGVSAIAGIRRGEALAGGRAGGLAP
jgi:hypothetical protein